MRQEGQVWEWSEAARPPSEGNVPALKDRTQLTIFVVSSMTVMAGATIAPALPAMARYFADTPDAPLWVRLALTLPALFTAAGAPLAGVLIDRFGRKRLLVGAMVLYGLGGMAGGLVSALPLVLVSRALLGLAVGGVMTTAVTLVADLYVGTGRAAVMGRQAAFMGLGGVVFLTVGGVLADLSWRAPFVVYGLAFVWLPFVLRFIPEPLREPENGRGREAAVPIPWGLTGLLYAVGFFGMVVFYMIPVQIPFYLERLGVGSAALVGIAIAASTLVAAFVSSRYRRVQARLGYRGTFALLFGLFGVGYGVVGTAGTFAAVIAGLVVSGGGMGLLMPNVNHWLGEIAPAAARGRLLGGLTTAVFLGQFCSPLFLQPLIEAVGLGWSFAAAGGALAEAGLGFLSAALAS